MPDLGRVKSGRKFKWECSGKKSKRVCNFWKRGDDPKKDDPAFTTHANRKGTHATAARKAARKLAAKGEGMFRLVRGNLVPKFKCRRRKGGKTTCTRAA